MGSRIERTGVASWRGDSTTGLGTGTTGLVGCTTDLGKGIRGTTRLVTCTTGLGRGRRGTTRLVRDTSGLGVRRRGSDAPLKGGVWTSDSTGVLVSESTGNLGDCEGG